MKTLRITVMVYHREKIQTAISQEKTCTRRSPWERSKVEFPLPTLHGVTDSLLPWHSHGTPPQSVSNKRHSSKPQGSEWSLLCHYTGTTDWLIYWFTDWLPHGWLICRSTSNCMTQSPRSAPPSRSFWRGQPHPQSPCYIRLTQPTKKGHLPGAKGKAQTSFGARLNSVQHTHTYICLYLHR